MTDPTDRLEQLRAEVEKERRRAEREARRERREAERRERAAPGLNAVFARRVARWVLAGLVAAVLPFFVLLRGSTWLYAAGVGTWAALAGGALLAFVLLAGYVLGATHWLRRRREVVGSVGSPVRPAGGSATEVGPGGSRGPGPAAAAVPGFASRRLLQGTAVLVVAYCAYGLVFLSGANAKSDAVRAEYRSLHPHLRMAVATLVLVDSDLLVTDAARRIEDYAAMGLPPNEASLHLEQADGWAHALDLRTTGRARLVNGLVRIWFRATGFRTLRHVGTADHLHVSLPLPGGR